MPHTSPAHLLSRLRMFLAGESVLTIDYLRAENNILRSKLGKRIPLTDYERRLLVRCAMPIKDRLSEIISIVSPQTILAWNRRMRKEKWTYDNAPQGPGRPRKGRDCEEITIRLATENAWGYRRIQGELRKLGHHVSASYVRDVLKRHGIPPSPNRKGMSWKLFIASHMDVTWAADFFTEEIWTRAGLVTCYVLFFIHLGTRRVHIAGCTPNPRYAWVAQQARNVSMMLDENRDLPCRYLIHDRDNSFLPLDTVLRTEGIKVVKTPPRTPMCNAFAERFVREARQTLDSMIIFGPGHLHRTLSRIQRHHNERRPHQGLGNVVPFGFDYPGTPTAVAEVRCEETLGGLLNHYYVGRQAA